jgi:uncharacterized membrane protein YfcA
LSRAADPGNDVATSLNGFTRGLAVNHGLIPVLAVIFFATFVRSTLGFGEALLGVPLLALFMPLRVAVPVMVLISITVSTVVLLQDWRHVQLRSAGWLVASTLIGTPLGLLVLTRVAAAIVKTGLGVVLLAFAAGSLLARKGTVLTDDRFAWPFGLGAGVLGGAYGMNGPPVVMYGALRGWSPQRFRATLQGYFLPASLASMLGYGLTGLWTAAVTRDYLTALPAVLGAILLGRAVHGRLHAHAFVRAVNLGLLAIAGAEPARDSLSP